MAKEPRDIDKLDEQIKAHPGYATMDSDHRDYYESGPIEFSATGMRDHNIERRMIWRHLYRGEPFGDIDDPQPKKKRVTGNSSDPAKRRKKTIKVTLGVADLIGTSSPPTVDSQFIR